jgi:hypothetical protein
MTDLPGSNSPGMVTTVLLTADEINEWLKEHPVIETEEDARAGKMLIDRAVLGEQDMEDERFARQRPHLDTVERIREEYREPKRILQTVLKVLKGRTDAYLVAETAKREAAAAEAARVAEELERAARNAERIEQDALGSVDSGELGVDIQAVVVEADDAFARYERAAREAARAERETKVKIGGGFRRSLGLRRTADIQVVDAVAAIRAVGLSDSIRDAIIKAARVYHREIGEYPPGVIDANAKQEA